MAIAAAGCPAFEVPAPDEQQVQVEGLRWQDPPAPERLGAEEAEGYCAELVHAGYDDWRLPAIDELRALVTGCDAMQMRGSCQVGPDCLDAACAETSCTCEHDATQGAECFHMTGFEDGCDCFKSSSSVQLPSADATDARDGDRWDLCFDQGSIASSPAAMPMRVRCVRGAVDPSAESWSIIDLPPQPRPAPQR